MAQSKEYMDTLSQQMTSLKEEGYREEFSIDGDVINSKSGKEYKPEDLLIVATYRFEGESNPGDSSELFAIETNNNEKGLLISAYGAQTEADAEVIKRIKIKE